MRGFPIYCLKECKHRETLFSLQIMDDLITKVQVYPHQCV